MSKERVVRNMKSKSRRKTVVLNGDQGSWGKGQEWCWAPIRKLRTLNA